MVKKCDLCNHECHILSKIHSPHFPLIYTLYRCEWCACRFFDVNEHDFNSKAYYEGAAIKNEPILRKFKRTIFWESQRKKIIQLLGHEPASVLDVGCRVGEFLLHFNERVEKEGVELSEKYARIARRRGITVYQDYLEQVNFIKQYELVSAYAILEHLREPVKFLTKLKTIVKKGGMLVISIPSFEGLIEPLFSFFGLRWPYYTPPEHLFFYSRSYLDGFLSSQGFFLLDRYFVNGGMHNPLRFIPYLGRVFGAILNKYDGTYLARFPLFDGMVSYYIKRTERGKK